MAFGRWGQGNTGSGHNAAAALAPSLWAVLLLAFASWIVLLAGADLAEELDRELSLSAIRSRWPVGCAPWVGLSRGRACQCCDCSCLHFSVQPLNTVLKRLSSKASLTRPLGCRRGSVSAAGVRCTPRCTPVVCRDALLAILTADHSALDRCASNYSSPSEIGTRQANYDCSRNLRLQWWVSSFPWMLRGWKLEVGI